MIPVLQPITAHPIRRPSYHNTPENLASWKLWFRANQSKCWDYWRELERAADADPERAGAMDEFWDFAHAQLDVERARHGVPL